MKAVILLATFAAVAPAQTQLHNGQSIILHGTLALESQGRLQFATIKTKEAYIPVMQGGAIHEIGLSGYHRYDFLAANRGHAVTIIGKMMTDEASPYYFNHAMLMASSIRLSDGTELLGQVRSQTVAADIDTLRATIMLPSDLTTPWLYEGTCFSDTQRPIACSSNGSGDVVNCYCPLGFHASTAIMSVEGKEERGTLMGQMAQFDVGEDPQTITLGIECQR